MNANKTQQGDVDKQQKHATQQRGTNKQQKRITVMCQ
jgi:hypothetical protein